MLNFLFRHTDPMKFHIYSYWGYTEHPGSFFGT